MTPVLVLCIFLCAASAAPAEKENLPADVAEPQVEMMRMMIKDGEQELPEDPVPELKEEAEPEQEEDPEDRSSCPSGWSRYSGSCYRVYTIGRSWFDAVEACHTLGAELASGATYRQYRFLQRLTANGGALEAWIGGFFVQEEWVWKDGLKFSYNGWAFHRTVPENSCVYLRKNGGWANSACSNTGPYICAKKVGC